ncbi:hypothetical protein NOF04DRAFT_3565 [Fusarium oxysporum II5]|uniref:Uncharacterized protein n=3 Tax=Fusarium oxysporum species complex TaxID=171631 RepID=N1S3I5_FUSC4|nr:uncharacterized protein FOIG_07548 [Fusarium odoratissimum NRRL 54006]EMT73413.1 hypothetical protein FOC4_g10004786 [Fusarium odoratissimum]EXM00566.1 hypothetical protein FOIG_07548 [Fusarium odoratissimum NRRL 54006]KAK2127484.1 hypothetical protein NOF04DRAFT_3565 [Fusarium oxysporum II5]TXB98218.1 hypothetical protein FocTR4_00013389 [Fusarium oxysporum f. sp. cubense]
MLMLPTIAPALAEFVYDKDISFTPFTEPDEIPYFGCLMAIHRNARLLCVAKDSAKHICLCCQNSRKKCGSRAVAEQIPDPLKLSSDDPDVALTIQTQDSAANRELLSLQLLQSAGANFSLKEMQARVAAATPLYARDDSKAVRMRKALHRLPNADKTPYGPDDGDLEDLPLELNDTLIDQMNEARHSGCSAPVCPPVFVGMVPVKRGPAQATPRKRKA